MASDWLWIGGFPSDRYRIGKGSAESTDIGLEMDWHPIGVGLTLELELDWHRIGNALTCVWHTIYIIRLASIGTGYASDWHSIGN